MLSGQRQAPIQEAVHMLDNQELVICSDMITYVSLVQRQAVRSENDKSKQKDLITVYRNRKEEHYPLSLDQYFYRVFKILHTKRRGRKKSSLTSTIF